MSGGDTRYSSKPLSGLCELLNGLAFKPTDWTERGTPIIRIQNLNGATEFNHYARMVSPEYVIPPGTILFSWSGNRGTSFGPFTWAGPTGILNQHIFKVTPKRGVDQRWLYHALSIARATAERAAHGGSGLVHVRRADLLSYGIPTPTPAEQRRIAEILDAADEAIRGSGAVLEKLRGQRAALLAALVPAEVQSDALRASPLGDLVEGAEYGISSALADKGAVPVLRMMNLRGGGIDLSDLKYSSSPEAQSLLLRPGDILFNRTNSLEHVGRTSLWRGEHPRASFASYCVRFVAKADRILPPYLVHFMNLPAAQIRIKRLATPAVQQANINPTQLQERFSVVYPLNRGVQQRAVDVLVAADARIRTEDAYLAKLKLQKQGLMQDLLTGRVRVAA